MKPILFAAALSTLSGAALADAVKYTVDASHSQVVLSYSHAGFSTTQAMLSGWEGEVMFDADAPENSSVTVSIAADKLFTGWDGRDQHFLQSGDFFKLADHPLVTFSSTGIEVTGDTTALITGDLTLNGVTNPVVLDAVLNATGDYPFPPYQGKPAAGFSATSTILRSAFDLGLFAPFVGDEVALEISIEAIVMD